MHAREQIKEMRKIAKATQERAANDGALHIADALLRAFRANRIGEINGIEYSEIVQNTIHEYGVWLTANKPLHDVVTTESAPIANTAYSRKVTDQSKPRTNKSVKVDEPVVLIGKDGRKATRVSKQRRDKETAKQTKKIKSYAADKLAHEAKLAAHLHTQHSDDELAYYERVRQARAIKMSTKGMNSIHS